MRLAGYDRSLSALAGSLMDDEQDRAEAWDEKKQEVLLAIQSGTKLRYGKTGNLDPADSDLHDKVCQVQKEIMMSYANGDDAAILRIMKTQCEAEIDSVVDFIWG